MHIHSDEFKVLSQFGDDDLLTTSELAAALGVTDWTIRRYVKRGMPKLDLGGSSGYRYHVRSARKWLTLKGRDIRATRADGAQNFQHQDKESA